MFIKKISVLLVTLSVLASVSYASKRVLDIKTWKTEQGIPVYFVPVKGQQFVDISTTFSAGSRYDGKQEGLAALTADMLTQGAANLSADQIASEIDNRGAILNTNIDRDFSALHLRTLITNVPVKNALQETLKIYLTVLSKASFKEADFERERQQAITGLQQEQQSPMAIANKALMKSIFKGTAYAQPVNGTIASLQSMKPLDLMNFFKMYYVQKNAIIHIVGGLTLSQAKDVAQRISSSIRPGAIASVMPIVSKPEHEQSQDIAFPSTQSSIVAGQVTINRKSDDYTPLAMGNYIFGGGGLTSILTKNIRTKMGYSYYSASAISSLQSQGVFRIILQTKKSQTQAALDATKKLFNTFWDEGPTAKQLRDAKKFLLGSFPLAFITNGGMLASVELISLNGLPLDYFDTYHERINKVTTEKVKSVWHKYLDPKVLTVVTVGQAENNDQEK